MEQFLQTAAMLTFLAKVLHAVSNIKILLCSKCHSFIVILAQKNLYLLFLFQKS